MQGSGVQGLGTARVYGSGFSIWVLGLRGFKGLWLTL